MVKKILDSKYTILLILLLALAMRLVAVNQSLWLDESIGAYAVKNFTYQGIFEHFLTFDNHPPLYYLLLKFWTDIFGYSEISLRLPSIIFGVGTVYVTYLIVVQLISCGLWIVGSKTSTRNAQTRNSLTVITASLLLATSPLHIYYSQEARMYSMVVFFAILSVFSFLQIIKDKLYTKLRTCHLLLFSFSITVLVFTDYVPVFLLPVFFVIALLKKKPRNWWFKFIVTFAPLLILGILWFPIFKVQSEKGKWLLATLPAWKTVAGGATFKQIALVWMKFVLGRISFSNKFLYYFLVIIASIPFGASLFHVFKKRNSQPDIVWMWLGIPLLLGFLASFWFPAFIYFRFIYVLPAFYILVALGSQRIENNQLRKAVVLSLVGVNLLGWGIYIFDRNQQREQWREAVEFVENRATQRDVVLFSYPQPFTPYRWYAEGKVQAVGVTNSISADPDKTKQKTKRILSDKEGVYYFEYLKGLSDPQGIVQQTIESERFSKTAVYNFPGVGFVEYYVR